MSAVRPKLTVAVPVYNGERYLPELFAALEAQTFDDFEVVIVDNASADATGALCRAFAAKDHRVHYQRNQHNIGAARNFNRAFELGQGIYFKWTAYDDVFAADYLARCVQVLDHDPRALLCHTGVLHTDENLCPLRYDPKSRCYVDRSGTPRVIEEQPGLASSPDPVRRFADVLRRMSLCSEIFGVIRREALARTSLHGSYYGSDKVLLAELALQGRFARVAEPLFMKRVHERTTLYFSTRERDAWIDPDVRHRLPQISVAHGYFRAIMQARLTPWQRLLCFSALAGKLFDHRVLKRFLLPGPDNYLALSRGRICEPNPPGPVPWSGRDRSDRR